VNQYLSLIGFDGFGPFKISIYSSMGVSIGGIKMTGETMLFFKNTIPITIFSKQNSHTHWQGVEPRHSAVID
jgi:hypothetical protein